MSQGHFNHTIVIEQHGLTAIKLFYPNYTYKNDRKCFLHNKFERFVPPPTLTGDQIKEKVRHFPILYEGKPYRPKNEKLYGLGSNHN